MKPSTLLLAALCCGSLPAVAAFAQGAPVELQTQPQQQAQQKRSPAADAIKRRAAPPPQIQTYDAAAVVQKANDYFNSAQTMIADFVQIGPDGRRTEGTLSVQRPGRLRFQYDPPATLDIAADGTSVAVRDTKLATQDLYFIGQTPLKFLLKDHIDLAHDTKVMSVADDQNAATIDIQDSATFGGTANIELVFDPSTFALKQWTVTDAQGYRTLVTLFDVDLTTKPDPKLFYIDQTNYNR